MKNDFDQLIKNMEQEIRDLKQVHKRGLGQTIFYNYSPTAQLPGGQRAYTGTLSLTVDERAAFPPVVLLSNPDDGSEVESQEFSYNVGSRLISVTITFITASTTTRTFSVGVVSTAKLTEVRFTV